jgi:hypothetical protein
MDRRSFAKIASLLAAGSAFGSSLVGCSEFNFEIPCLGLAPAPATIPGMTYIRASDLGCALDCDLSNGRNKHTGGRATDDAPRMNAAMAAATAEHPITLIIDGSAMISGLFLPAAGNWSIAGLGCGTGFFVKTGANNDGIHNGPADAAIPFNAGPPAPPRGKNVSLSNFTLNGNQGDGHDGNSTSGMRLGSAAAWFCGINLMNLDNITIQNVVVVNTPSFHFRLSNVGNVAVDGCVMKSFGISTDGLHFDGPSNDITITNCNFTTGDDAIALNCPEGYTGDITRVSVSNCTFNSLSLMRIYTTIGDSLKFYARDITVSNCNGTFSEAAFVIGLANQSNPDSIYLSVTDCSLTALTAFAMAENFGDIVLTRVTLIPVTNILAWNPPVSPDREPAFMRPSPMYETITSAGSNLTVNDCLIHRDSDTRVTGLMLANGSTIANLTFNGFAVQDAGSYRPVPELLNLTSGSIGQLMINSLTSQGIIAPVSPGGFTSIGLVSGTGTGVLTTAWEFPDGVMADAVPYISANSGLPSIKVNGVVEPYS